MVFRSLKKTRKNVCTFFTTVCNSSLTYTTYKPSHRSHTIIPLSNHHTIIIPKSIELRNIYIYFLAAARCKLETLKKKEEKKGGHTHTFIVVIVFGGGLFLQSQTARVFQKGQRDRREGLGVFFVRAMTDALHRDESNEWRRRIL